jgi:O-antigen ligase
LSLRLLKKLFPELRSMTDMPKNSMNRNQTSRLPASGEVEGATVVSCWVIGFIALILGIYWPLYAASPDIAVAILRPAIMGGCFILMLVWSNLPVSRAEMTMSVLMAVQCVLLLVPTLAATDPVRAFEDWAKLVILCILAVIVARALRNDDTANWFAVVLLGTAVILTLMTIVAYLKYMGPVVPTYISARAFKGIALKNGIPLNAIPFASVLAFLCSMCLARFHRRYLYAIGVVIFVVSIVLTGSRTPLAISVLSGLVLILLRSLRSPRLFTRFVSYATTVAITIAMAFFLSYTSFSQMSSLSEGRWDLWSVACEKFVEHPVFGSGFESWRDDLVSRLPGEYSLTASIEKNIAGGYHNEYLTLLAEQGLVGFIPTMLVFFYLFRCSWKLAYRNCALWTHGGWALFTCLFVFFRASLEVPGLFGYGQEPADYLAFFFFALAVSRVSREEVCETRDFLNYGTEAWSLPA